MPVLLYVLVPGISADLGISIAQADYLTSGFAVGMVVGAPLTAALGSRLPPRWTLSACLLVFVAAHAVGPLLGGLVIGPLGLTGPLVACAVLAGVAVALWLAAGRVAG